MCAFFPFTATIPDMKLIWALFLVLMEHDSVLCYSVAQRETTPLQHQMTLTPEGGNTRNLNFLESTYDPGDGKYSILFHSIELIRLSVNLILLYSHGIHSIMCGNALILEPFSGLLDKEISEFYLDLYENE